MASRNCRGGVVVVQCPSDCEETPQINLQNINLNGIGVLDGWNGVTGNFRGVASANGLITVTLDNVNHTILLTPNSAAIVASIPQATTTVSGIGETATDAEAQAKTSILAFLTPSNLAAVNATTTSTGLVELATDTEANLQTANNVALVPSNLAAIVQSGFVASTFNDAVVRAAAVPKFSGSIGYQLDTEQAYVGNSPGAGDWKALVTDTASPLTFVEALSWVMPNGWTLDGSTNSGSLTLQNWDAITFDGSNGVSFINGPVIYDNATINYGVSSTGFTIDGVPVAANSVMTTKGGGFASSRLLSTFISTANTQTGWGTPTGTVARATYAIYVSPAIDVGYNQTQVQALSDAVQDVSNRLAGLITDLKAVKLPAV